MSIGCCSKVQNNIAVNKFNPFEIGIFSNLSCVLADNDETFWVSLVSFELPSLVWRSQVFLHWSEVLVVQLHHYMNLHLWCNLVQIAPTNRISFLKIGKEMPLKKRKYLLFVPVNWKRNLASTPVVPVLKHNRGNMVSLHERSCVLEGLRP